MREVNRYRPEKGNLFTSDLFYPFLSCSFCAKLLGHSPLFFVLRIWLKQHIMPKARPKMDTSGYPALEGGKTSSDGDLGVCKSQCHWRLGIRINANTQQAGQMDTLGSGRTSSHDACQSAVLVTRAAILQDAHRMSCSSTWHI